MKLVIFDLDQTLVEVIPVHDRTAQAVFQKHFGVDVRMTEVDFAGKSLIENFLGMARLRGISESEVKAKMGQLLEDYDRMFVQILPKDATRHILPGVGRLLEELSHTDNIVVLYTGDSAVVGNAILQAANLDKYFRFCFFGTEVASRGDMVRLAIGNAECLTKKEFKDKDIVIIGDSIRDVECGKQFNALIIAVTTGSHSREELLRLGPDYIFPDLRDYRKILQVIG